MKDTRTTNVREDQAGWILGATVYIGLRTNVPPLPPLQQPCSENDHRCGQGCFATTSVGEFEMEAAWVGAPNIDPDPPVRNDPWVPSGWVGTHALKPKGLWFRDPSKVTRCQPFCFPV